MKDPLEGTAWSEAGTVAGFAQSAPNAMLMRFAEAELAVGKSRLLDIGSGAGRNAVPLARQGWSVAALDLSLPMLHAAASRGAYEPGVRSPRLILATMDRLPIEPESIDFIVAHGIWNLARTTSQFRAAVREAARVAKRGCALFVFTFSRTTLPPSAKPVDGEEFVYTEFSGSPQCFVTESQLVRELGDVGFTQEPAVPLAELNRPPAAAWRVSGPPVIYQGAFRYERQGGGTPFRDPEIRPGSGVERASRADASRAHLLGLQQVLSGERPRLRKRHDSHAPSDRAVRRGLARMGH
jgi:SAM-dependent methyltransferase